MCRTGTVLNCRGFQGSHAGTAEPAISELLQELLQQQLSHKKVIA